MADDQREMHQEAGAAQEADNKKKRRGILIVLLLLLVVAGAGAAWWRLGLPQTGGDDPWYDPGMSVGFYDGKPEEDVVNDLNAIVAENEMNVSCAPIIYVDHETGEAEVRVESIAANHVDQKFTITLDDETVIYESGAVSPGSHVQTVTLDTVPEVGDHSCVVTFQGYDPASHEPRGGSAALRVTLSVS